MKQKFPFEHEIRNTGLKVTEPRLKILSVFEKSKARHLSAEDIHDTLKAKSVVVGMATIYRALANFEKAGILNKSTFDDGRAIYEINEGPHHDHIVCVDCGNVEEFVDEEIEKRQKKIANQKGYSLKSHSLVLYGSCSQCLGKVDK
ncbi:MAG: ferric iron uptake transcriptional regulator [Proteobacteria bacterium]|jgi:Fur family ferric uptake transcriptional regulator|nr:ferric iron uptake transcriptional regulator [Pseudomonadota bacterium]|tara:strand:+ start:167 stop:604 length:438 start_codon:yes stop_codon:yes gene_type:complete